MPRRKQQNPQPVKLDSADGTLTSAAPGSLTLEADFLLGHDIEFGDPDHDTILGLDEKYSDSVATEIGFSVFPLGDDVEGSVYSHLSMESDTDDHAPRTAPDTHTDPLHTTDQEVGVPGQPDREVPYPTYLSCRGCGLDLVGPYCYRCCKGDGTQFSTTFGGFRSNGSLRSRGDDCEDGGVMDGTNGRDDSSIMVDDGPSSKLHSCQLCGFSSRYANHVKRHMKTHNGEKPYRCPLCTYASAQLVNLQRHLRIHTGEKPYKCERCSFACSSLGNLKRHQRMHLAGQQGAGQQGVGQQGAGQEVVRPASGSPTATRPPIGHKREDDSTASLEGLSPLELHQGHSRVFLPPPPLLERHPVDQQPPRSLETPGVDPGTEIRARSVGRPGGVKDRVPHPLLFPFTCRLCGISLEDEDGSSTQICARCTLDMLNKESSGPHSPGERGDKVYTCSTCPFLTHYPNHLARHMKTHSGEKPYKCPQCDYASAHFDNLKRHHRVHTGEKPYKCVLCDYACGNLANLKRHQRVHSGAKPFQCAVCSYSCNQSMNLKRHMLRHTGEKPYKCQDCGYTTGHWDNYKRHQKKHGLATDNWVKVQMPGNREEDGLEEEDDDEEEEDAVGQLQRKDAELGSQFMTP
ncbi:hypothetical protein UPYG_G00247690 [Umbra pygmaea]|uniref:Zinc finger protein 513 n=1 Tax=Umbra pygmaea TaxID=75934 RepID=A0ABD0W7W5_UMBPY